MRCLYSLSSVIWRIKGVHNNFAESVGNWALCVWWLQTVVFSIDYLTEVLKLENDSSETRRPTTLRQRPALSGVGWCCRVTVAVDCRGGDVHDRRIRSLTDSDVWSRSSVANVTDRRCRCWRGQRAGCCPSTWLLRPLELAALVAANSIGMRVDSSELNKPPLSIYYTYKQQSNKSVHI